MGNKKLILSLFVTFCISLVCRASSSGENIGNRARSYIGSRTWLYSSSHVTGVNTNKCNIFVADVLKEENCPAPNRSWWRYSPIGAGEWANPNSEYLNSSRCWEICDSPVKGDVIAMGGHVGIVSGSRNTTSASALAQPRGLIVENDWGFRSDDNATCWRYRHNISNC
ncbi:hypothetical protein ACJMK2_010333 [Sinanodonta woodiana]|uniref:Peptidase C51 domain-containing protein n=1 Tax=Sinanodonta woodiana TaxID=1069815 RepID=A0ABD3VFC5_SINWO